MTKNVHHGDLTITAGNADLYKNLHEVTGSLDVGADFQAPVLTRPPRRRPPLPRSQRP